MLSKPLRRLYSHCGFSIYDLSYNGESVLYNGNESECGTRRVRAGFDSKESPSSRVFSSDECRNLIVLKQVSVDEIYSFQCYKMAYDPTHYSHKSFIFRFFSPCPWDKFRDKIHPHKRAQRAASRNCLPTHKKK